MVRSSPEAAAIVAAARGWIGTQYHHQAALKGVGCDCLGLVRGVWREVFGNDATPFAVPVYTPDWGDVSGVEDLLNGLSNHLLPIAVAEALPGDVLAFRMRPGRVAKHCAIMTETGDFVHAWEATPAVEVTLSDWWARRIVAVFRARGTV